MKDQNYQDEVDLIVRDERRNKFIVNLTTHLKGNTLVLISICRKTWFCLYDMMKDLDRKVFYVHGVEQTHKQGRIFVKLQKMKKMQSLLRHMVLFLLVLIFVIFTMSCSVHHQKVELECYNQLVEDCEQPMINPPPLFRYRR